MVREDLVNSAVTFLQDPSVASAPVEKRIAFLQSKNLTQEEVDAALARAGGEGPPPSSAVSSPAPGYGYQQPPPPPGYGAYPGYWQQPPPPPPVPKRDWRDWFIMATVMGGVGYGLYFTAKRYIYPLIAPPTPPQLEQDKKSIDESFEKAFALLDQLNTDTTALKAAEEARTQRLDSAVAEMESVMDSLKESLKRRDADSRRLEDDVRGLRDLIPKALEAHKEGTDNRLKDLSQELKSLKTLVGNRMGSGTPSTTARPTSGANMWGSPAAGVNGGGPTPATPAAASSAPAGGSTNNTSETQQQDGSSSSAATPAAQASSSPYARFSNGRAAIPAWQMAAAKKNDAEKKDTSESGTVSEAGAGA
ncbi:Peroxisome membrane anchor protein Pex14p [Lasiodiplodia theobromae]|uniref:Peroxisomal membrane protein PEX14 n=1 Tax=Lasiodiplodia theobromae TaxID=45133 RepID=A0A5N5DH62_9PEZI|nr:Peroxisome membrane anchor protein Pex14p [Lasiodiplodia theobromae]KAB2577188.1 Peroxisomal membrane protein PER10 [Lasiodiplodia theobromae]KAF4543752.1 Peroxisome membrane anchor protein Pex14p [Lasiodiplodia theobromae]KAF9631491.1 Peroxisome membrane anchor protein Pex14p [Lasiodiplodia theobromae]